MPGSTITNPSLNDDLRDDDPDSRNQELDDERRIEADNEYYDGDKDQASFFLIHLWRFQIQET
jgi:hypothetical protein